MSNRSDDLYSWLDDPVPDLHPPPAPAPPPAPELSPPPAPDLPPPPAPSTPAPPAPSVGHGEAAGLLPASSPDGAVTYTSIDTGPAPQSFGAHGTSPETEPEVADSYRPPPPGRRSTGIGSAGRPQKRGGILGFLGSFLKFRLILGAIGLAIGGIAALFGFGEGSVQVSNLEPGVCFEAPGEEERRVNRVTVQDCALAHGAEMFAEIRTFEDEIVGEMCLEELFNMQVDIEQLPDDFNIGYFEGVLTHRCIISSPSGQLVGSILD